MARRSEQDEVTRKIREYLALAENSSEEQPLDVSSVAKATETSRTTLYKYNLQNEIKAAAERRVKRRSASPAKLEEMAYAERMQALKNLVDTEQDRNKGLVARLALIELNAARLGIDPEKLLLPIKKPDRRVSRAGSRGRTVRNTFR